jgi:hypothetical protein
MSRYLKGQRLDGNCPAQFFHERAPPLGIRFRPGAVDSMGQFNDGYSGERTFSLSLGRLHVFEDVPNALAPALSGNEQA